MNGQKTYLTSNRTQDKAAIGLTEEMLQDTLQHLQKLRRDIKLDRADYSVTKERFIYSLVTDLERIEEQNDPEYEVWMEYSVLEELQHLLRRNNAMVDGEIQDMLREYSYLQPDDV